MLGVIIMYKLLEFIGAEVNKTTRKINNLIFTFNSVVFSKKSASFSVNYKLPKKDTRDDYKKIGKDFYKAFNHYLNS